MCLGTHNETAAPVRNVTKFFRWSRQKRARTLKMSDLAHSIIVSSCSGRVHRNVGSVCIKATNCERSASPIGHCLCLNDRWLPADETLQLLFYSSLAQSDRRKACIHIECDCEAFIHAVGVKGAGRGSPNYCIAKSRRYSMFAARQKPFNGCCWRVEEVFSD